MYVCTKSYLLLKSKNVVKFYMHTRPTFSCWITIIYCVGIKHLNIQNLKLENVCMLKFTFVHTLIYTSIHIRIVVVYKRTYVPLDTESESIALNTFSQEAARSF